MMQNDLIYRQLRMVGYARVSTDEEKQLYSLDNQLAFFTEFSQTHNYKMVRLYADEGISGKQLKKRDEFMRMLEDAKLGIFDVVVVKDVSRFARNTVDLLTSIRALRAMGINVLFVNNNQQTLGESEFVITLLGAMAQEESANLSRRVQFGKDVTAKRGRVPRTILGYDYVDNYTLTINEEEAALVRRIYEMYLSGFYGMSTIAAALRGENILTKLGCDYTEGYIRRILTNPIYYGDLVNHKTQIKDFINGERRAVPEKEQYHHDRPELAIISRETFDRVQRIREERCRMQEARGGDPRRRYTSRYLFSGLVRCGDCGCTMYRQNVHRKGSGAVHSYWRCKNGSRAKNSARCSNKSYIPDHVLREGLSEILEHCVGDKAAFAREIEEQRQLEKAHERPVEELVAEKQRAVDKLLRSKQKLVELYTNDILTMEELKLQTGQIAAQLDDLDRELAMLKRDAARGKEVRRDVQACIAEVVAFLDLEEADNAAVRKVLSFIEVGVDKSLKYVLKVG